MSRYSRLSSSVLGLRGAQTVGRLRGVQVPPVTLKQELVPRAENVRARHDVELLLGGVAHGDPGRRGAGFRRRPQTHQGGGRDPEQNPVRRVDREGREEPRAPAADGCPPRCWAYGPGPWRARPSGRAERRPALRCPAPRPGLVPARSAGAAAQPAGRDAGRAAWRTLMPLPRLRPLHFGRVDPGRKSSVLPCLGTYPPRLPQPTRTSSVSEQRRGGSSMRISAT